MPSRASGDAPVSLAYVHSLGPWLHSGRAYYAWRIPSNAPFPPAIHNPNTGLCDTCRHQQLVPNTRGSVFSLCTRSRHDPAYPRYPRLPVLTCPGYERRSPS